MKEQIHLIEYPYDGATWVLEVPAFTSEEAEARVWAAAQYGGCYGVLERKVPASLGWWAKLLCWWRNRRQS